MALGLFLSRCDGKMTGTLDLDALARDAGSHAACVRIFDSFFDETSERAMVEDVTKHGLDAVVLAGHSVGFYERSISGRYLWDRLEQVGVNRNRIIAANLLQQVDWAHADDPAGAHAKARALIAVAALEADMRPPADGVTIEPVRSVLILGATTEALVAAQRLLDLGFEVLVADRGSVRDGFARDHALVATSAYVLGHPKASFADRARMVDGSGWVGDHDIKLETARGAVDFKAGGILLADPADTRWVRELRLHFKVDVDDDGHARSIDPERHPAETEVRGILVVPVYGDGEPALRDRVAAADSAALALVMRLTKPAVFHHFYTSRVDEALCGGCASCVRTCAFGACAVLDDKLSHVDERRCRGCGKCVVSCPVGARDLVSSPHRYLMDAIELLAQGRGTGPKVLGFLCGGCGYPAADRSGNAIADGADGYPASFLPIRIPCGGRLDALYVLEAFKRGFDAVVVFRCREGHCHNLIGNVDMDRRVNLLRTVLRARAIDAERLRIVDISPDDGAGFAAAVNSLYADLALVAEAGA